MNVLKFKTLFGVCEYLTLTGLTDVSLKRVNGIWEMSHDKGKLN